MKRALLLLGTAALVGCSAPAVTPRTTTDASESTTATTSTVGAEQVVNVVDGDTFDVQRGDKKIRVRVLGIDTPETVDPSKGVQCGGPEASKRAKELLLNQRVVLTADPTQHRNDMYGRELDYVAVAGQDYSLQMIEEGWAKAYKLTSGPSPQRYNDYLKAQEAAKLTKAGMWGTCATMT